MNKSLMAFFVVLMTIGFVSAAADDVTLVTPAASVYIAGTYNFSATVETPAETANVSFRYNTTGDTQVVLCTSINATEDLTSFSCEADTSALSDGTFSFYAYALDDDYATELSFDESATVVMDNTAPTITISVDKGHVLERTVQRVTCTFTDATATVNQSKVMLTDSRATKTNWTYTDNFEIVGSYNKYTGEYTAYCLGTDKAGNQATASTTYSVYPGTSGGEYEPPVTEEDDKWKWIIGIALALALLWFATQSKK